MLLPNQIGKDFANSSQRLVYNFIALRAEFIGVDSDIALQDSQKQFYDFMSDVYLKLYEDPAIISMHIAPDETEENPHAGRVCENWWHAHLEPRKLRRKNHKILNDFFATLALIGEIGQLSDGKLIVQKSELGFNKPKLNKLLKTLSQLGLECSDDNDSFSLQSKKYPLMCAGWKLLSNISKENNNIDIFIRSVFNVKKDDALDVLYRLSDKGDMLRGFIEKLQSRGFTMSKSCHPSAITSETFDIFGVALTKAYKTEDEKEIIEARFRSSYRSAYKNQLDFDFIRGKNPFFYLNKNFDRLNPNVQAFVYKFTGGCSECGSCIVNEAAKKRENPYSFTTATYNGEAVRLCHVYKSMENFTGYHREHRYDLDEKFLADVLELFDFFEENLSPA